MKRLIIEYDEVSRAPLKCYSEDKTLSLNSCAFVVYSLLVHLLEEHLRTKEAPEVPAPSLRPNLSPFSVN